MKNKTIIIIGVIIPILLALISLSIIITHQAFNTNDILCIIINLISILISINTYCMLKIIRI